MHAKPAKPNAVEIRQRLARAEVVGLTPRQMTAVLVMMRSPMWTSIPQTTQHNGMAILSGGALVVTCNELVGSIPSSSRRPTSSSESTSGTCSVA